jgi:acetate kinase
VPGLDPRARRRPPRRARLDLARLSEPGSAVLVVNAGSTSLKLALVEEDGRSTAVPSLEAVEPGRVGAVGHRVVHGGAGLRDPVPIDDAVRDRIAALTPLAPLHNAPALDGIDAARRLLPRPPHVAVFDTAFHATMPDEAAVYAVPRRWSEEWGIRRYGFHGISAAWSAERAPVIMGRGAGGLRLAVCHLGGGSSVTAVLGGRSVDTTMGFTPLEGLPMTTRSGSIDPGALLYLLRERGLSADELDRALNEESGLRALSGGTGDVREIEIAAAAGDPRARLALAVLGHRVAAAVAAAAASLGGLDALAFTAGAGEGSAAVRAAVCARLEFLGVRLDPAANARAVPDCDVAPADAPARVLVIAAREELVIARAVREALGGPAPAGGPG